MKITATIRDALIYSDSGISRATGKVERQATPRFPDGHEITTSKITGFDNAKKVVFTLNSTYFLLPWRELARCPCCDEVFLASKAADGKPRNAAREFLMQRDALED